MIEISKRNFDKEVLDVTGFEVYNLGVDAPKDKFIQTLNDTSALILGLSGYLTPAFDAMKETMAAVEAAGMRDKNIMIGDGQMNDEVRKYVKADTYGKNAMEAVKEYGIY